MLLHYEVYSLCDKNNRTAGSQEKNPSLFVATCQAPKTPAPALPQSHPAPAGCEHPPAAVCPCSPAADAACTRLTPGTGMGLPFPRPKAGGRRRLKSRPSGRNLLSPEHGAGDVQRQAPPPRLSASSSPRGRAAGANLPASRYAALSSLQRPPGRPAREGGQLSGST